MVLPSSLALWPEVDFPDDEDSGAGEESASSTCTRPKPWIAWFSDFTDGRLYRRDLDGSIRSITPDGPFRYADLVVDRGRDRLICVREDHTDPAPSGVVNELVAIPADGGILLLHENCEGWGGLSGQNARRFIESVDHPNVRYLFDIGNTASYGQDTLAFYRAVRPFIAYVHVKDCRRAPAGGKSDADASDHRLSFHPIGH